MRNTTLDPHLLVTNLNESLSHVGGQVVHYSMTGDDRFEPSDAVESCFFATFDGARDIRGRRDKREYEADCAASSVGQERSIVVPGKQRHSESSVRPLSYQTIV